MNNDDIILDNDDFWWQQMDEDEAYFKFQQQRTQDWTRFVEKLYNDAVANKRRRESNEAK